jgi:hypothetical protein
MFQKLLDKVQKYSPRTDCDGDSIHPYRCDYGEYINFNDITFKNFMKEIICQAHMAGQIDAGCKEPSWSNAHAYFTIL